ncbi:MAG: HupE/UreJ family protein [Pseudomonadota bacterium]
MSLGRNRVKVRVAPRSRFGLALAWILLGLVCAEPAQAHEVRPGYLEFTEAEPGRFAVVWKQPVLQGRRLPLTPVLPDECEVTARQTPARIAGALLERFQIRCSLRDGRVHIDGLTRTLTDVLLSIRYQQGDPVQLLLKPDAPAFDLSQRAPGLWSYLRLGVEHLWFGIDHVLFVVLLVLYVRQPWPLVKTVTAFTAAHSVTLSAAVFDWIRLPQGPVEAIIALSIVFLARELMLPVRQRSPLTQERPYLMAFGFGLLHGFGFAGALADIGLPEDALWVALLLFNLGLELGQLSLIVALLAVFGAARALWQRTHSGADAITRWPATVALLLIGGIASFWTIERCLPLIA